MNERGFSLVEVLVAMSLTLLVTGALLSLIATNSVMAATTPEMADAQQRARAGADLVISDLTMAGAGMSAGPLAGSLLRAFAPVIPRKVGLTGADPFDAARPDALTITFVPPTHAQALLAQPMSAPSSGLQIDGSIGCPLGAQFCGLQQGSTVLVFDDTGRFDLVSILGILGSTATIEHRQQGTPDFVYQTGAGVAEAESHTYYFDRATQQLRHADGAHTDVPVIDNVVDVVFEYFGDPVPPIVPRPPAGVSNCLYDSTGTSWSTMPTLTSGGSAIVALPLSMFSDGPWCGAGSNRFDADLLRIRVVRVTMRVQVNSLMMRGVAGAQFAVPGRSRSAARSLPDYMIRFDVAPRNMNPGK